MRFLAPIRLGDGPLSLGLSEIRNVRLFGNPNRTNEYAVTTDFVTSNVRGEIWRAGTGSVPAGKVMFVQFDHGPEGVEEKRERWVRDHGRNPYAVATALASLLFPDA